MELFEDASYLQYESDCEGFEKMRVKYKNFTLQHYQFYQQYEFLLTHDQIAPMRKEVAPIAMHHQVKQQVLVERKYKQKKPWYFYLNPFFCIFVLYKHTKLWTY